LPISTRASDSEPPVKLRCLNRTSGTIGSAVTFSQYTKLPRATTATARGITAVPLKAPCCGIPMIHQTRATMPTADSTAPGRSGLRHGPFDSGMRIRPARMASTTTGMLMKKIACQEKRAISTPPSTGLPTRPSIATEVHAAIALRRSSWSKTTMRMDSVDGMIRAPPTPIATRTAIISPGLVTKTAASDAAPNRSRPMIMTFRRPNRSPRLPEVSSNPAKIRM
jgi:hypothetical protein